MSVRAIDELQDFHDFLSQRLAGQNLDWSPEEAVDEWRRLRAGSPVSPEDVAAIQEALTDLANGDRGIPFEEFDREFRKRHSLPGLA
jgi:hypothetical protein